MRANLRSPAVFAVLLTARPRWSGGGRGGPLCRHAAAGDQVGRQDRLLHRHHVPARGVVRGRHKPIGSDIDIGTGIAAQMGVKASFKNTTFDSIIAALNDEEVRRDHQRHERHADRRKQVDFVDYLKVGQSLMVKKGNPEHIGGAREPRRQARLGRVRHDEPRLPRGRSRRSS